MMNFSGIDYGSRMAGTTAICFLRDNNLLIRQSAKKQDADAFIEQYIQENLPGQIFIDAPLSLPKAYYGRGDDFMYRQCDRELQAMSPMFLGGLTARAMSLAARSPRIKFFEAYPKLASQILFGKPVHYKKDMEAYLSLLIPELPYELNNEPVNWHQVDALLAWMVGYRFQKGINEVSGDPGEGLIYV